MVFEKLFTNAIILISFIVDVMRQDFLKSEHIVTTCGKLRCFHRDRIFDDVIETYRDDSCSLLSEYPLKIGFGGEPAIDAGGVGRDMFSCF